MKKKVGKIIGMTALGLVCVLVVFCFTTITISKNYVVEFDPHVENTTGLVMAHGKSLYDKNGNPLLLRGTNAGSLFVPEGWLTVYSIGRKADNSDYLETYEQEVISAMKNNPNLTDDQIDELWSIYYTNWWTDADFVRVKEAGMNVIRLPFTYTLLMKENANGNLVMKDNAYYWLDWFVEGCKKHELYCILDLHCAPGGQSGYEHSGTKESKLFSEEKYQEETKLLWTSIARHYTFDKAELGTCIAAYDIFNEPTNDKLFTTNKVWKVMDKVYDAIRETGDKHVICLDGCWEYTSLPSPSKYGWENVMYEYHLYNWLEPKIPYWAYNGYIDISYALAHYDVPYYIGEFNWFDNKSEEHWQKVWGTFFETAEKRNFSWTTWNGKAVSTGWWSTSWGLYNYKMHIEEADKLKVNLATDDYATIKACFESLSTVNWEKGPICDYITNYLHSAK